MDPRTRRALVLGLFVAALLALAGAVLTVLLAPDETPTYLGVALAVLVAVALAEILLAVLGRRDERA